MWPAESTVAQTTSNWKETPMPVVPLINGSYDPNEERSQQLKDLRGSTLLCMGNELKSFVYFVSSLITSNEFTDAVENRTCRIYHWSPELKEDADTAVGVDAGS